MTVQAGNPSDPPPDAPRVKLSWRIAAALIHTVPFGLFAGPVVASFTDWPIGYRVALGGVLGLVAGLVVGTADWLELPKLLRRRRKTPVTEQVAPPKPAAAIESEPTGDLWVAMIFPPYFAGIILCIPLMGTPVDGSPWGNVVLLLFVGAVFVIWARVVSPPRLRELARRGEWVPAGTMTHPYWVAFALTALNMAAVVAVLHVGVWVLGLFGL
jgi:hypothetical protein